MRGKLQRVLCVDVASPTHFEHVSTEIIRVTFREAVSFASIRSRFVVRCRTACTRSGADVIIFSNLKEFIVNNDPEKRREAEAEEKEKSGEKKRSMRREAKEKPGRSEEKKRTEEKGGERRGEEKESDRTRSRKKQKKKKNTRSGALHIFLPR